MIAILRRWWRQLTSMRTALVLLFGLAVAAVPGSVLPQRNVNAEEVEGYFSAHPKLAPFLDSLWGFDVYSAPWFAAIYLLLFVSLVGCLVPRFRDHIKAIRRRPPDAPARMSLLPQHRHLESEVDIDAAQQALRRERFRVTRHERDDGTVTIAAEKGFLREAGNLVFHFALLLILAGVGVGALFGWHGNRILVDGENGAFCNSLQQYDDYGLSPNRDATDLPPFCLQMDDMQYKYIDNGQPVQYAADVRYSENGQAPNTPYHLEVNSPLEMNGASVFLLGHDYAPVISYEDRYGNKQTSTAPFIAEEGSLTSAGAAVFPDANVDPDTGKADSNAQVAFEGIFIPDTPKKPPYARSMSPSADNPGLMLSAFRGDTGLDDGKPQSVYEIDQEAIKSGDLESLDIDPKLLKPGDSMKLDDDSTVTFEGFKDYATLEVRDDPGEMIVLVAAVTALVGLIPALTVRRRRVWVRVAADGTVATGGLSRTEYEGFQAEFDRLSELIETDPSSTKPRREAADAN